MNSIPPSSTNQVFSEQELEAFLEELGIHEEGSKSPEQSNSLKELFEEILLEEPTVRKENLNPFTTIRWIHWLLFGMIFLLGLGTGWFLKPESKSLHAIEEHCETIQSLLLDIKKSCTSSSPAPQEAHPILPTIEDLGAPSPPPQSFPPESETIELSSPPADFSVA